MYALIQNNQIVKTAKSIREFFPNTSLPAKGLSKQELESHGIIEVREGEKKDDRFYWVTPANPAIQMVSGMPTRVYVNTAKELEDVTETPEGQEDEVTTKGLKSQWVEQVKANANSELAATDWYVVRKAERDVAIPQEIVNARAAIVAACTAKEAAITAATTVDELKEVLFPTVIADEV